MAAVFVWIVSQTSSASFSMKTAAETSRKQLLSVANMFVFYGVYS